MCIYFVLAGKTMNGKYSLIYARKGLSGSFVSVTPAENNEVCLQVVFASVFTSVFAKVLASVCECVCECVYKRVYKCVYKRVYKRVCECVCEYFRCE